MLQYQLGLQNDLNANECYFAGYRKDSKVMHRSSRPHLRKALVADLPRALRDYHQPEKPQREDFRPNDSEDRNLNQEELFFSLKI